MRLANTQFGTRCAQNDQTCRRLALHGSSYVACDDKAYNALSNLPIVLKLWKLTLIRFGGCEQRSM